MSAQILKFRDIPQWAQQLAGILPLSALIEFIDVGVKLHLYELTGRIPLWNWPITPAGARLLSSSEDTQDACCLDRVSRSVVLHCIDGKYGDWYPCSTPTTTRLCLSVDCGVVPVRNESPNLTAITARRQRLTVVHVTKRVADSAHGARLFQWHLSRYRIISFLGWLLWITLVFITLIAGQYFGLAYYLLMPITGIVVRETHGHKARQLRYSEHPSPDRLVVVSNSLNAAEWWAFYGEPGLVNAILNRPLCRATKAPTHRYHRWMTQILVISQWILAVGSCALQNWNALFIALWIAFCALESAYAYPPEHNVRDWLRHDCEVMVKQHQASFASRRAMLSALVYVNPDSKEGSMNWINPILADCQDRREWEAALLLYMKDESKVDDIAKSKYWWKFILEGVEMGKKMKTSLHAHVQGTVRV